MTGSMNLKLIISSFTTFSPAIACLAVTKEMEKKTNIVFTLADEQCWDASVYAGNKDIRTPAADKTAEEGSMLETIIVPDKKRIL